jgi:hypothetical protein
LHRNPRRHFVGPPELATPVVGPAAAALPLVRIAPILSTSAATDSMISAETNTYSTE